LILLGASVLLLVAKESSVAGVKEKKNTEAYGIALAGLQWSLGNLSSQNAKETITDLVVNRTAAGIVINGKRVFPFNQNGRFAGVPTAPPAIGTSTDTWSSVGKGHYALLADYDPLDPARSMVMRAIGIVSDGEVILESSVTLNPSQGVPSGFVGCFNSTTRIDWNDNVGPYDYIGNYRFDGGPGFPIAVSNDAPQINGFVKVPTSGSTPTVTRPTGYPISRQWRGTQSLRVEPLAAAIPGIRPTDVENRFGGINTSDPTNTTGSLKTDYKGPFGTTDTAGPQDGYAANAYLANDPRIVDAWKTPANGDWVGLGFNGSATAGSLTGGGIWDGATFTSSALTTAIAAQARGLPLLSFKSGPAAALGGTVPAALLGQNEWLNKNDSSADMGFYACRSNDGTLTGVVEECIKGTKSTTAPNWSAGSGPVNQSGRAWNLISDVVRQCSGSGRSINKVNGTPWYDVTNNPNGIRCARGFEWLENVAACLIVPASVKTAMFTTSSTTTGVGYNALRPSQDVSGAAGYANDFDGCHPGCLIATDVNADGAIDAKDHPFRSSCINLDPSTTTTYGPGATEDTADASFAAIGSSSWTAGTEKISGRTIAYAAASSTGPSAWQVFNRAAPAVAVGQFKSVDATTGVVITPGLKGGFVREPGNPAYIERLDMSDRGPLGTCEQNCLAYGYGRDRTYGAHRTDIAAPAGVIATDADRMCIAKVPLHAATGFTNELCNLDYNLDGFLDRKSYALFSSYREECASPNAGLPYAPAVDISSDNDSLLGDGCMNRLPNHLSSIPPTYLTNFCDGDNDATFLQAVNDLTSVARTVTSAQLLNGNGGALAVNDGWFGSAKCHVGTAYTISGLAHTHTGTAASLNITDLDRLQHQDFWIEDSCPNPVVIRVSANKDLLASQTCGCGILIIENAGLTLAKDSFFMWRGLVIWNLKDRVSRSINLTNSKGTTFYVDGALVVTGGAKLSFNVNKDGGSTISTTTDASDPPTAKVLLRMNRRALDESFRAVQQPVRTIRRLR
jgi:hypothetical protein